MPKVAVYENDDPGLRENYVRLARQILNVLAKPQSAFVQFGSHFSLESRVFPFVRLSTILFLLKLAESPYHLSIAAR